MHKRMLMDRTHSYSGPSIIPHLWYRDQNSALALLKRAFGFSCHFSAPEEGGGVHAELRIGNGFVMVGPSHAKRDLPGVVFRTPCEIGEVNTGAVYIATQNVQAIYEGARGSGVAIVRELHETTWGSRDFSARDGEGYLWNFGTYHPTVLTPGTAEPREATREAEVFCTVRYARARDAIGWLTGAFGLEEYRVFSGDDQRIEHALLRFGTSLLIASSLRRDDPLKLKPPAEVDGIHTQVLYVVVPDPDAHCARARAACAEVLFPPTNMPWGARLYMARDLEGYPWCFSTYGPVLQ